jgi:hypothetical protein
MKVPIGLGTIVGYLLTTLSATATAWAAAEGGASHLSPGLLAVLTVVAGSLTSLGRMYQAKTPEAEIPVLAAVPVPGQPAGKATEGP